MDSAALESPRDEERRRREARLESPEAGLNREASWKSEATSVGLPAAPWPSPAPRLPGAAVVRRSSAGVSPPSDVARRESARTMIRGIGGRRRAQRHPSETDPAGERAPARKTADRPPNDAYTAGPQHVARTPDRQFRRRDVLQIRGVASAASLSTNVARLANARGFANPRRRGRRGGVRRSARRRRAHRTRRERPGSGGSHANTSERPRVRAAEIVSAARPPRGARASATTGTPPGRRR